MPVKENTRRDPPTDRITWADALLDANPEYYLRTSSGEVREILIDTLWEWRTNPVRPTQEATDKRLAVVEKLNSGNW